MRIRGSVTSSVFPTPTISPSSCSPSSSSSCFSSSSTISDHSLSSSSNSTSSSISPLPIRRCQGLDLLVKAVYHVAGSVVGVPYIQKRIIRRRKPAVRFNLFFISSSDKERVESENGYVGGEVLNGMSEKKTQKRSKASGLTALKPGNRRRRRSKVQDRVSDLGF